MNNTNNIAYFIKYQRKKLSLTQEDLAEKAGVGLRFIRDIEQGKVSLRMDKVNQVLKLFGYKLLPEKGFDSFQILFNYINKNIKVSLKNKSYLIGFIIQDHWENNEIRSWDFISNNHIIEFQQTQNKKLISTIKHEDIEHVELVVYPTRD